MDCAIKVAQGFVEAHSRQYTGESTNKRLLGAIAVRKNLLHAISQETPCPAGEKEPNDMPTDCPLTGRLREAMNMATADWPRNTFVFDFESMGQTDSTPISTNGQHSPYL